MNETQATNETQNESLLYEIRFKGRLAKRWAGWFGNVSITLEENGNTLITARVIDQAALYGLLSKGRDLGLQLISVNYCESKPAKSPDRDS